MADGCWPQVFPRDEPWFAALHVAVAFCLTALVLSCESTPGPPDRAADRAEAAARIEALFRVDATNTSGADVLGDVRAARVTSDGQRIVVLDRFEPFVRVLDRRGRLIRAFASKGAGPGELKDPLWLAVQGDSVIAAWGRNGLSEFSFDGEFLGSVPALPVYITGLAEGCGDGWLVLGPKHFGGGKVTSWVREVPRLALTGDPLAHARVLYSDSVPRGATYLRGGPGVMVSGGGHFAFLRHLNFLETGPSGRYFEGTREFFEGDCATGKVTKVESGLAYAGPDEVEDGVGPGGRRVRQVHMDPGPRHQGLGLLSAGVLVARRAWDKPHLPTVLNLIGWSDSVTVRVPEGVVTLRDARPGVGALFSTSDPWPRVVFVPEALLLAAFGVED